MKHARGNRHLRDLEERMRDALDAKTYTVIEKANSYSAEYVQELLDPPELPPEWGLLIGDFAYNTRAALDQLAWVLAEANEIGAKKARSDGKPWPPERTEFPVFADVRDKGAKKALDAALLRFTPAHAKIVDHLQPHHRGLKGRAEPLWLLKKIRDADAHRVIHTMLATVPLPASQFHRVSVTEEGRVSVEFADEPNRFEELQIVPVKLSPGDTIQTTFKAQLVASAYVTFDQPGADFHGQEVLPLLNRCRDAASRIIELFAPDFP